VIPIISLGQVEVEEILKVRRSLEARTVSGGGGFFWWRAQDAEARCIDGSCHFGALCLVLVERVDYPRSLKC
jgi:hypothetical protein